MSAQEIPKGTYRVRARETGRVWHRVSDGRLAGLWTTDDRPTVHQHDGAYKSLSWLKRQYTLVVEAADE